MTKKSAARLERDAREKAAKENRVWDEVKELIANTDELLLTPKLVLDKLESNKPLIEHINRSGNGKEISDSIKSIVRDINTLSEDMEPCRKSSEGRSGKALSPEDFDLSLNTALTIQDVNSNFQNIVLPTLTRVTAIIDVAEAELSDMAKQAAESTKH